MTFFIGIDPGLKGAIAILTEDAVFRLFAMPTMDVTRSGKDKAEVSASLLYGQLRGLPSGRRVAALERVGAMPGQGVTSVFSFGRSVGIVEGVLAALEMPVSIVPPQKWQKAMEVRGGKDGALLRATELFPEVASLLVGPRGGKLDGFADALLIAAYIRQISGAKK